VKILEYAACGYPIIASDVGPYADTLKQGETGILCQTTKDWEGALEAVYTIPDFRKKLGETGQEIARTFDMDRNSSKLEEFFLSL